MGTTPHYNWTLPTVGSDSNTWGGELNTTTNAIDGQVYANQQTVVAIQGQLNATNLALVRTATFNGTITFNNSVAPSGQQARWIIFGADTEAESGGNAGTNFQIVAYNDAGAYLGAALTVNRASQRVQVPQTPVGPTDVANKSYVDALAAPIGSIVMWSTSTPPANWTWCGGQSLPRTGTYAALFAVIGTTYNAVDGSHFNLPNLFSVFPFGFSGAAPLGTLGGEANHTLTAGEMPVHNHTDAGHAHSITDVQHLHLMGGGYGGGIGPVTPPHPLNDGTANTYTGPSYSGITGTNAAAANISNTGGGAAHNNMPPYTVIGFIIRYA